MNVFQKATLASLKRNRIRTSVTIIGIALSTSLMTAVTSSVSSLHHFLVQDVVSRGGIWQGSAEGLTAEQYEDLTADQHIKQITASQTIGYADAHSENDYKPYLYLMGISEDFTDLVGVTLISGELPKNSTEILIPDHLGENGCVYYEVGDTLTLEIGERMKYGFVLDQSDPYVPPEEVEGALCESLEVRETRTYTVCGIYGRPEFEARSAPGYTCLTRLDSVTGDRVTAWFTMKHPTKIFDFMRESNLSGDTHDNLLRLMVASRNQGFLNTVYGMAAILIALIVFGSVSLIYNAFAISVSERTKQFGLLSSIGATRRQLRYMVRFEAFCVSAVGIPLGVLIGLVGIMVTFLCIGSKITEVALSTTHIPMRLHVSWIALACSVAVSIVTVLISAWIPSRRATKVSAVEAIRQSTDIKANRRSIRTPKWIYKLFGLPGMLSHKYFTRSRKKYRATILSLFMSVVLFISSAAFTEYLQSSVEGVYGDFEWDLSYHIKCQEMSSDQLAELARQFRAEPLVEKCTYTRTEGINGTIPAEAIRENAETLAPYSFMPTFDTQDRKGIYTCLEFVDDETFRDLLRENHLSEQTFMDLDAPQAVAIDHVVTFDEESRKFKACDLLKTSTCSFDAQMMRQYDGYQFSDWNDTRDVASYVLNDGDWYDEADKMRVLRNEALIETTLQIGAVLHEKPPFIYTSGAMVLIYPISAMDTVLGDAERSVYVEYNMLAPEHKAAKEALTTVLSESHLPTSNLYDEAAAREHERDLVMIIRVFCGGFIVLISLIAAANVFNTISTNVALRRREFAMLRSIGMTDRGLLRMMNYECILYGTRALAFGLPVSAGVTVLIWLAIHQGYETGFRLLWEPMGIAVCLVYAVVFASMLYAMQKLRSSNTIDELKNENL